MVAQESRFTTSKDTKNVYEPTENYLDHSAEGSGFPAFEIKLTKVDSVRLLLASDEVDVIQKVESLIVKRNLVELLLSGASSP